MRVTLRILSNKTLQHLSVSTCRAVAVKLFLRKIFIQNYTKFSKKKELSALEIKFKLDLDGSDKTFGPMSITMLFLTF